MHLDALFKAGIPPTSTVGQPGIQGAIVIGIQGIGVKTPKAAAVAAATIGFAILVHIPNGRILIKGLLSMILAHGVGASVLAVGKTISVEGAAPKVHCVAAPITVC